MFSRLEEQQQQQLAKQAEHCLNCNIKHPEV
jgi:hypothetical protein